MIFFDTMEKKKIRLAGLIARRAGYEKQTGAGYFSDYLDVVQRIAEIEQELKAYQ